MSTVHNPANASSTRQRILDAAAKLFREKGYAGTSQRDIAAACELQAASLYHHFASKEEVLAEVLDQGILRPLRALEAALDGLDPDTPPRERLRVAIATHLNALFFQGDYTSAHFRIWKVAPPEVQAQNVVLRDRYEAVWVALLERLRDSGDIRGDIDLRILRLFLIGGMNLTLDWYQPGDLGLDDLARMYTEILLNGVGRR
jgi:TetR/AcrR family transcriptional regulator, cholesterol catabolism regulator